MEFKVEKESFFSKLADLIYVGAVEVVGKSGVKPENIIIDHPASPEHGDYSTNIALRLKRPENIKLLLIWPMRLLMPFARLGCRNILAKSR